MSSKSWFFLASLALCNLALSATAEAGLLGKTLSIAYYSGTTLITATSTQVTVTGSVELTGWPSNTTQPLPLSPKLNIDVTDTSISISNDQEIAKSWRLTSANPAPLYLVFKDTTNSIPDFSSDPTKTFFSDLITGISSSDLSVTVNSLSILLNDAILPTKSSLEPLVLQVGFADSTPTPVPSPPSILLLTVGLLLHSVKAKKPACKNTAAL